MDTPEHSPRTLVGQVLAEYLLADPQDARFRAELQLVRRLLQLVDQVLEEEGVPADVRGRIVRTALYGTPDPDAAVRRLTDARDAFEQLSLTGNALPPEMLDILLAKGND